MYCSTKAACWYPQVALSPLLWQALVVTEAAIVMAYGKSGKAFCLLMLPHFFCGKLGSCFGLSAGPCASPSEGV